MTRIKPSPAAMLAFLALLVALSGSSYAAPARDAAKKLVTGKQVKKGSLTGAHIKDRSLTARDIRGGLGSAGAGSQGPVGPQGPKGDQGPEGKRGLAGADGASMWAMVGTDGSLHRGKGVIAARRSHDGQSPGQFQVDFNRSIANCGWVTSLLSDGDSSAPGGMSSMGPSNTQAPQNRIDIATRNSQGQLNHQPFAIAVYC